MQKILYRAVCALLTLVFVCSGVFTGTLGWQSVNQETRNETAGVARRFDVQLLKQEKGLDGTLTQTPIPGAAFYLFTQEGEQIGGRYVSDENGNILVQLPYGSYYFEEIDPSPGYDFDRENGEKKTRYPFTITGSQEGVMTVPVYNVPLQGALTIRKLVDNADQTPLIPEQQEEEFTFTVTFSDGGTYSYRVDGGEPVELPSGGTLTLKHGQTAVFDTLPVGVLYTVVETPKPGYHTSSTGHQGNITVQGCVAEFVNTYDPEVVLGSLTVTKEVVGEGADPNKTFTFTATVGGEEVTFTLKAGESFTLPDLPVGTEYTVTETAYTQEGYVATVHTYHGVITGAEEVLLPFVNVYYDPQTPPEIPGSLSITKQVVGENPDGEAEFVFAVTFSDGGTYTYRVDGGEPMELPSGSTLTLKAGQTAVFDNLPHGVTYTVEEVDAAGYRPTLQGASGTIVGGQTAQVTVLNAPPEAQKPPGKLTVTKVLGGEYPAEEAGREFHFTLIVDGVETSFVLKPGETLEFDLPAGSHYEVREEDYYPFGFSQSVVNGSGVIQAGEQVDTVVTNTYIGTVYTEITGEKTWDLMGYPDDVLPTSITLRLMHGDMVVEEVVVTPDENGEWHYTFQAPKYDQEGNEIQYTVVEVPMVGFNPSYDGFNVKNTYVPPVSVDPPILQKVVEGEGAPQSRFEFLLTGQPRAPMPEGSSGNTKILTMTGPGEMELGEITFQSPGVYVYTVEELHRGETGWTYDTARYTLTVTVTEENGRLVATYTLTQNGEPVQALRFVNQYQWQLPPDKTVVAGDKTWHHGSNPQENWPAAIVVEVYGDGVLMVQRQVTARDGWSYSFQLPKYADDGHEIVYTVDEAEVPGYETQVDGYHITNVYVGATPQPSQQPKPPQTGDANRMTPYLVTTAVSGGLMLALMLFRPGRKRGKRQA